MCNVAKKKQTKSRSRRKSGTNSGTNKGARVALTNYEARVKQLQETVRTSPDDVPTALELAETYGRIGREEQIVDVLTPLEGKYPFADAGLNREYNRLLTYGYGHQNRCIEAEDIARRAIAEKVDSLDIYYVMAYVKLTMREYDEVIEACSQFMALYNAVEKGRVEANDFSTTRGHVSQLYNFLATAFKEKGDYPQADTSYRRSIAHDAANHLPYLNLANLLHSQRKTDEARKIVQEGLKHCRQIQELRMLEETLKQTATISACMIVKNEEEMLRDCLESIRDWVDEIILVDTGSTDRTVEIAKEYGAKVFFQEWEGNFSKHRNFSLQHAQSDWIFIIDADERFVVEDLPLLRPALNSDDYSVLSINVYNVYKGSEERSTFLPSVRFWRRKLDLKYEGIVHNALKVPKDVVTHRVPVRLKHLGYDLTEDKMAQKAERTSALLDKQLQENPDNSFALFNYAQLLAGRRSGDVTRHADRIIEMASRAVELTSPDSTANRHIHLMCLNHLAWTNFFISQYKEAARFARQALTVKPNYLDPLLLLGHIAVKEARFADGRRRYQEYLEVQKTYNASHETDNIIVNHIDSRVNALYGLAMIAEIDREWEQARRYYEQALEIDPEFLEANGALGRILLTDGDVEAARRYFERQTQTPVYSRQSWLGLGRIAEHSGDLLRAEHCYRQMLAHDADDSEAVRRLANVCLRTERTEEAVTLQKRADQLGGGSAQARLETAASLFAIGQYREAAEVYRVLVAEHPGAESLNDLGNCYFRLEEYDLAAEQYRQALECQPITPLSYRNLGLTEARLHNYEEAIEAFKKFLEMEPGALDIVRTLGDLYVHQKEYVKALPLFERFLVAHPRSAECLHQLADCYLHMGHEDSAIMGYRRALEISPGFKRAQQRLNELLSTVGQA